MPRCTPSTLHTLSHLIPPTALAISYYLYPHFSDKNAKTGAQSPVILSSAIQGEEGQGYIHVPGGTWRRREGRWPGREHTAEYWGPQLGVPRAQRRASSSPQSAPGQSSQAFTVFTGAAAGSGTWPVQS